MSGAPGIPPVALAAGRRVRYALYAAGFVTALVTPLAFPHFACTAPPERLGQTIGAAEIGREPGDAGGPLRRCAAHGDRLDPAVGGAAPG